MGGDMTAERKEELIELRVDKIAQLFHTLDPFPFRERDLDREAEDYIVGWARELPSDQRIRIVVHFSDSDIQKAASHELSEAFGRYFSYRADTLQRDLNELFRVGRRSLGIGALVLVACLIAAHLVGGYLKEAPVRRLVEESFLLLGWVANWRPLQTFLTIGGRLHAGEIYIAALREQSWKRSPTPQNTWIRIRKCAARSNENNGNLNETCQ